MNVLFVAGESVPFFKTGGLADVIGSLPQELKRQGIDVRVMLPKYEDMAPHWKEEMKHVKAINVLIGWRNKYCGINMLEHDGITYYFIDNEYYFKRSGYYGYGDDAERFTFFCEAALEVLPHLDWRPDVIHCHDWQTGMIPVFLKSHYALSPFHQGIRTVFTIHNLKYQGIFPEYILQDMLNLGYEHFHPDALEYFGCVNFMKGGLVYSDVLSTVSKSYAEEITMPYYGEGLDGLLRKRRGDLFGIINGIDYHSYNPGTDTALPVHYQKSLTKKQKNKLALQEAFGLAVSEETPLIGIVTRLVHQKGLDLISHVLDELMQKDVQVVVVGTGEPRYEGLFRWAAERYPQKLSAHIYFDEGLARRVYAASDFFLMPSLFEPCGIGQLIAMRYLSIPIVRETGGLKDTVMPYNQYTGEGWGFSFSHYNAHDMLYTVKRAIESWKDRGTRQRIRRNMQKQDFSWHTSANQYRSLYEYVKKHK
ncbi:glycogen synthase GlgA [Paenibacillus turpanensis]|uniref:glycogen synthase GlgA n=1 Tax=Paenibacillus turpanensis TaxID=2689078 RepID=UPI001409670D